MKTMILLIALIALTSTLELSLTCGDCTVGLTDCPADQKCYQLKGDGFRQQRCSNVSECLVSAAITYNIVQCSVDFQGNSCPTSTCAAADGVEACYDQHITGDSCIDFTYEYTCGACQLPENSGCTKCAKSQNKQICVDTFVTQCDWSVKTTTGVCANSKDGSGNTCNCCASSIFLGQSGKCTDNDPVLNSYRIEIAAQLAEEKKKNEDNQLQTFEGSLSVFLALLGLLMIVY